MAVEELITPNCPSCNAPPLFTFMRPYFCSNDECNFFSWNPMKTAEWLLANVEEVKFDADEPFTQ